MRYRKQIAEVVDYLQEQGYEPVYVALYGSQNYELDNKHSDFDYKAFIKPTRMQIYKGEMTIKTLDYKGGQIEVRDFRLITDQLGKMNPHFIELFKTQNYWVDGYFSQHFNWLKDTLDQLLCDRFVIFTKACYGACVDASKKMITEDGYNPKKLYTIARLYHLYKNVCDCKGFILVNKGTTQDLLIELKSGVLNTEEAIELANYYVNIMRREKEEVEAQGEVVIESSLNKIENILIDLFNLLY